VFHGWRFAPDGVRAAAVRMRSSTSFGTGLSVNTRTAATRAGDLDAVIAVLAPGVVRRADQAALPPGRATEVRGARAVAEEIVVFGWNARFAEAALVNGSVGIVVAPRGRLQLALTVMIEGEKIVEYELVADPTRLQQLNLAVLPE
jgi:hypothetical protein